MLTYLNGSHSLLMRTMVAMVRAKKPVCQWSVSTSTKAVVSVNSATMNSSVVSSLFVMQNLRGGGGWKKMIENAFSVFPANGKR